MFTVSDKKQLYVLLVAIIVLLLTIILVITFTVQHHTQSSEIIIDDLQYSYIGPTIIGSDILSEEEFEAIKSDTSFVTYEEYVSSTGAAFSSQTPAITALGANATLYDYCDGYFHVYYGYNRISPVFPMALANVETPGRADNSITWSALFPSKYVDVDKIDTFCVVDVVSDPVVFAALSTEYSTRDRGALQMSPTYGTGNHAVNNQMSGTEAEKLRDVTVYSSWVSGASKQPGDRFYLPDVLLRLQVAMQGNIDNIVSKGYLPETDTQLIAMLAVAHNSGSGVWSYSNHDKKVGNWKSGTSAYELCKKIGAPEFVEALTNYALNSNSTYINTNEALFLYSSVYSDAISDYTSSTTNGTFGIKALYAYIKLSILYTQGG